MKPKQVKDLTEAERLRFIFLCKSGHQIQFCGTDMEWGDEQDLQDLEFSLRACGHLYLRVKP